MINSQHLIDSVVFDTTYAEESAAFERTAEIDDFVKNSLMKVVDEVFDKVNGDSSNSGSVFRIEKLEIDLGKISYRDYRQIMPAKLREQLVLMLTKMRQSAKRQPQTKLSPVDTGSAEQAQLFYFLRNGHLPWYSRLEGAGDLESMLIEAIDSTPAILVEFMRANVQHAGVIERLRLQFSQATVNQVMQLLPSSEAAPGELAMDVDELLHLLESVGHDRVKAILDLAEIIQVKGDLAASDRSQSGTGPREHSLAYLLLDRGDRFDERSYIVSLLRQLAASSNQSQSSELVGELSQRLRKLTGEKTDQVAAQEGPAAAEVASKVEPYSQYDRVKAMLTSDSTGRRFHEPGLLADISALAQDTPWLLMRLYRELQGGNQVWELAVTSLPVSVLAELTRAFLSMNNQSGAVESSASISELSAAIQGNLEKSKSRQFFLAHILGCLIKGELIDFDAISDAEHPGSKTNIDADTTASVRREKTGELTADKYYSAQSQSAPGKIVPRQILQCAELLTTASYATSISLSADQLEKLKWRFIDAYLTDTGNLFNESYFSRQYVEILIQQAKVGDTRQFRSSLSQGLLQNSLPSTRDMTRRLIELLADEIEDIPARGTSAGRSASESKDESAPLEDIYIANAGVVLVAPYLPRLFERLGLIDESKFNSRDAAEHGIHCLQFLVNESISSPEYQLVLNKLLCGVRPGRPIRRSIALSGDEKGQLEALLDAITQHWKALGNTSIAGLRDSFLQRNGRLQLKQDAWHLSVEARPFDMLLDQIPWSFSTIKFPWMDRVIYVEWR